MSKRHLKVINAPRTWPIERKEKYWIVRPNPGPHSFKQSMPIGFIITDLLKYTKNARELRKIIYKKNILVNGKAVNTPKFPVGLFDIIELKGEGFYRLLFNLQGKFVLEEMSKNDTLLYKVVDKKIIKKNKLQLNLSNGSNLFYDKKDVNTGDSISLEGKKVKDILKLEKDACIYLTGGKHIGVSGVLEKIEGKKVFFKKDKEKYETLKKYAFVIGSKKPMINIKNE